MRELRLVEENAVAILMYKELLRKFRECLRLLFVKLQVEKRLRRRQLELAQELFLQVDQTLV